MSEQISLQDAAEFIWREADILDRCAYEDWLDLWADDGLYIVPIEKDAEDYAAQLNYAYDDAKMRKMRVARLTSSQSQSAVTAAQTVRTVSRFVETDRSGDGITLRAAQHLAEYRRDLHRMFPAELEVELRRVNGEIKLVRKIVKMANSEDAVAGIAYLP